MRYWYPLGVTSTSAAGPGILGALLVRREPGLVSIRKILNPDLVAKLDALDRAVERRTLARQQMDEAGAECRALVVELLRAGVPRGELVDRPFSSAWLTRIQREERLRRGEVSGED